jgi:hypothetical protein
MYITVGFFPIILVGIFPGSFFFLLFMTIFFLHKAAVGRFQKRKQSLDNIPEAAVRVNKLS